MSLEDSMFKRTCRTLHKSSSSTLTSSADSAVFVTHPFLQLSLQDASRLIKRLSRPRLDTSISSSASDGMNDSESEYSDSTDDEQSPRQSPRERFKQQVCVCACVCLCVRSCMDVQCMVHSLGAGICTASIGSI